MGMPLEGITVFDLTLAGVGPYGTMPLAALGADVVKIEAPGGDLQQRIPPYHHGLSTLYACANLGKRSVTIDLKDETNRALAYRILRRSDVFVQNMRPGVASRLGFDPKTVREYSPGIVHVDVSAWGSEGPIGQDSGSDGPVQAFSGFTSLNGALDGPSEFLRAYGHIDYTTSQVVTLAVLEGLLRRRRTGEGQYIEATMLGASLLLQFTRVAEFFGSGEVPRRRGSAAQHVVPDQTFACLGGEHVAVSVATDEQWRRLVAALGADDLAADSGMATNPGRLERRDAVIARLAEIFATKPARWWEIRLRRAAVPVARPLDPSDVANHPQVRANEMLVTVDTPTAGEMIFSNVPWRLSESPARPGRPPVSGEHSEEIAAQFGDDSPPIPFAHDDAVIGGTLEGLTVLDTTQGHCGPLAGMLLAELGATVVKLEPATGDYARSYGPPFLDGVAPAYWYLNRLKERRSFDWAAPEASDLVASALEGVDVVLEDAESAVLGIGRLAERHPGLVRVIISGFGAAGPLADAPASELVVQAMTGCFAGLGGIGEAPERIGADVASANAAMHAVQGVLAALLQRSATGRGLTVGVDLLQSLIYLRGGIWPSNADPDEWVGHQLDHATQPPSTGWRTRDLPVTFLLGRLPQADYEELMGELGMQDCLDDARFVNQAELTLGSRVYAHEVRHLWERATAHLSSAELAEILGRRGGELQRLNDYPTLFSHPQIAAIRALVEISHPSAGTLRSLALPWRTEPVPR